MGEWPGIDVWLESKTKTQKRKEIGTDGKRE